MLYKDFAEALTNIAPLLNWRLTDKAIQALWKQLPNGVDDNCLMGALDDAIESQARVPALLMEYYKQRRRVAISKQAQPPALPPASHDGQPCIEFVQLCRMMRERREGRFPDLKAACQHLKGDRPHCESAHLDCRCLAEWNARPLTEDDWQLGRKTQPAAAIAGAIGGNVPAIDPKEGDVVWVD